jgi:hypothetical protein
MKFGKSAAEAAEEPSRGGGGGDFIRYLKDGDTTFRILQEPDDWTYYWEHFSPSGFSFCCPREPDDPVDTCPGCSSDNEKMSKVSRKIAFNVLQGYNGQDYVNVYKVSNALAEKFKNRYARQSTITDRDYTITKFKAGDRVDYDVEGSLPSPVDVSKYELKDINKMLADQYYENWGDTDRAKQNQASISQISREAEIKEKVRGLSVAPAPRIESQDPPSEPVAQREEKEVKEDDLRRMTYEDIISLVKAEVDEMPPPEADTTDKVVDWLMGTQG